MQTQGKNKNERKGVWFTLGLVLDKGGAIVVVVGGRDSGWLTVLLGFLGGFFSLALVFLFLLFFFLPLFFFFTPPTIGWLKTHLYPPKKSSCFSLHSSFLLFLFLFFLCIFSLSHYSLFCYFLNQTLPSLGSILFLFSSLSLLTFFFYLRSPCFSHSPYLYAMTKLLKPFSWWNDCGH